MSVISAKDLALFENACEDLIKETQVRHVAVINKLGKKVAGSFKKGVKPLLDNEKLTMTYMQLYLDFSMRKEVDDILGPIDYIVSRRKNLTMISLPTKNFLILITAERDSDDKKIIKKAEELFDILPYN